MVEQVINDLDLLMLVSASVTLGCSLDHEED